MFYRVFFNQSHVKYNDSYCVDIEAKNAKEACQLVKDRYYTFEFINGNYKKTGFCPMNRKAQRIEKPEYIKRYYIGKNAI